MITSSHGGTWVWVPVFMAIFLLRDHGVGEPDRF